MNESNICDRCKQREVITAWVNDDGESFCPHRGDPR